MTLQVKEKGELGQSADRLVSDMFDDLVHGLREHYGAQVPTDGRLAELEIRVRNFIWDHVPEARWSGNR